MIKQKLTITITKMISVTRISLVANPGSRTAKEQKQKQNRTTMSCSMGKTILHFNQPIMCGHHRLKCPKSLKT